MGHQRLADMASAAGAQVRLHPIDLGRVFPVSGGLQLKDRAVQRQAYRLVELARFRDHLKLPLNLQPAYFPVVSTLPAKLIVAVQKTEGETAALKVAGALMSAVWAQERNIADPETLGEILRECGSSPDCLSQATSDEVQKLYDAHTDEAIEIGIFGAPTYVLDGEMFWGQDRLMFLEHALAKR